MPRRRTASPPRRSPRRATTPKCCRNVATAATIPLPRRRAAGEAAEAPFPATAIAGSRRWLPSCRCWLLLVSVVVAAVLAVAWDMVAAHVIVPVDLREPARAPPSLPRRLPVRAPPSLPRRPKAPHPDDDDEILCDCGWTRWPGQSCRQTQKTHMATGAFPCWDHCCHK